MSKYKIVNLIDKIFVSVSIFLIIFAWINFYTRNLWISFVLSLIFSFACIFILYYCLNKKQEKNLSSKKAIEEVNKNFLAFRLMAQTEQLNFLKTILKEKNATIDGAILSYKENDISHSIIIATNLKNLSENDFLNIVQLTRNLDTSIIEILCESCDNFNTKILRNKTYKILTKDLIFKDIFKAHNTYPFADDIDTSRSKTKFVDILKRLFLPHKAKPYFACGLVLIFSSVILPNHSYYIIFGSMLLLFAIICKIKKTPSC